MRLRNLPCETAEVLTIVVEPHRRRRGRDFVLLLLIVFIMV
jgi:hypothetical protein